MNCVISTTYDDNYFFFLPIVTWSWNKLGVDVICFMPFPENDVISKLFLLEDVRSKHKLNFFVHPFKCPYHKAATYAQCSRLYAAALDLPEQELLFTSDVDMAVFKLPPYNADIYIHGADLVPTGQFPMCYSAGTVKTWRQLIGITRQTYQELLDDLLGDIDCEHMRGNYWGLDQEMLYSITNTCAHKINRARPGTQFAKNRVDRDDINWESYIGPDLIDAHLWRPGYTDENFVKILQLFQTMYPEDNFDWMVEYRNEYVKLIP